MVPCKAECWCEVDVVHDEDHASGEAKVVLPRIKTNGRRDEAAVFALLSLWALDHVADTKQSRDPSGKRRFRPFESMSLAISLESVEMGRFAAV